jgi:hypothetical protein
MVDRCNHSMKLVRAAIDPMIRKNFGFSMPLQSPLRKPPNISPGRVAANQTPINIESACAGARLDMSASPIGAT